MRVMTSSDVPKYVPVDCSASKSIVTSELQDKVKIIDSKKGEYVIEKVAVETSRIDTREYVNSFRDDVGIENILKKFDLVKDPELLNQVKRPTVAIAEDGKEVIQDYSGVPTNEETAFQLAQKAQAEFANLPQELVKGRSFNEFAETCSKEELLEFISSLNVKQNEGGAE